jgi:hypothetical protein
LAGSSAVGGTLVAVLMLTFVDALVAAGLAIGLLAAAAGVAVLLRGRDS